MKKNEQAVHRQPIPCLEDVIPQAILWRTIYCFALDPERCEDELDQFHGASFTIGNQISFDLRHYDGHPESTVTIYLPIETRANEEIAEAVDVVLTGLEVPETGVAWRRGEDFEFGKLPRRAEDRLRESEARLLALKIAAECKNFEATTTYIKNRIPEIVPLTEKDLEQSKSRPREKLWQQIVGNVISHSGTSKSIFARGFATRTNEGIRVTKAGINYLKSVGFLFS
ncbi:hypothetical protein RXV95_12065 [Novosphingobium sp. ZN18A2]|uniref:hypothetical protein n=1 Tax=Novosphingobium sp. ZN18A2 TaxID=3079861 RepID=UPI0030D57B3A